MGLKLQRYQEKIVELLEAGKLPKEKLSLVEVAHDDGCNIFNPEAEESDHCNCDADIYLDGKKIG